VELSVVEQRYQAVLAVIRDGVAIVEVARRFGVSRQAVHRWLRWYEDQGLAGLADRSHRPARCSHQMDPAVEVWVLEARRRNPDWGPRRLVHEGLEGRRGTGAVALGGLSGAETGGPDRPRSQMPANRRFKRWERGGAGRWNCGRWTSSAGCCLPTVGSARCSPASTTTPGPWCAQG
jgi:helix-turn-helix protein